MSHPLTAQVTPTDARTDPPAVVVRRWRHRPPHLATVPLLRGRLHQVALVVSLVAGVVLVAASAPGAARVAASVYAVTTAALFATSSAYHRRAWTPLGRARMRRLDHSMILVLIAGSATPLVLLGHPAHATTLVLAIWGLTAVAVAVRVFWRSCPPWLVHPLAVGIGGASLVGVPRLVQAGEVATLVLLVLGVAVYVGGMVVLIARRPDPRPSVFGYHEVFHALTLVAGTLVFVVNARVTSAA